MSTRNRTVFVAHPLSAVTGLSDIQGAAGLVRAALRRSGWEVLPARGDTDVEFLERMAVQANADVLRQNVEAVARSEVLVVLVPPHEEPSSIWIEFGVALASRVAILIVTEPGVRLPFLARSAFVDPGSAPSHHRLLTIPSMRTISQREADVIASGVDALGRRTRL